LLVPLLEADPRTLGGKGAALHRLAAHGLPVPPTWVVPVGVFRQALRAQGREALAVPAFEPPALPALLAVRSSATDEDGRGSSAAGQYESVLGVTREGLPDAIRRVWASWFSPRALAYRKSDQGGMAVLVQGLVDARSAGVLFTVNPVTGSWREMTVEAVWGVGEPLVSGGLVPDRYTVRRPRRTPRPMLPVVARVPLRLEGEVVAAQPFERVLVGDVLTDRPAAHPEARKVEPTAILEVCRLGLRAESLLGGPQDVEWARDRTGRFWVLQSRPVTTRARLPRGGAPLWTRRFLGERFPEGSTPLGWDLVGRVLEWFIAYPETSARYLGGEPPLRRVHGHPYINVTVFRHLAFKLPGTPPPRFMLDFFPPSEVEAWVRRPAAPPDLRVYGSIFRTTFAEKRWRRFRWNPFTNWRRWDQFRTGLDERIRALEAAPVDRVPGVLEILLRDYVKIHITSLLFANMAYEIIGPLLDAEHQALLVRAPAGSVTRRVNAELYALGRDPSRLGAFLAAHGHRARASWELTSPRWADDPEGVLRLAALAAREADPGARLAEEEAAAAAALAQLPPALRYGVRLTQAYLRLREEQRYHLDRFMAVGWRRVQELGARWFPEDPSRVRYLHVDELDGRLGEVELRRTADRRAAEPVDADPPDFLVGDAALPAPAGGRRLQGLGISPGVVRGRVCVLRSIDDAERLSPGGVLVARATDPTWTPLFGRAGALVLELGSMLSHGAVVAREYRLPGVVNLPGVTSTLRDGDEVTVDGRAGVVWVHTAPESAGP